MVIIFSSLFLIIINARQNYKRMQALQEAGIQIPHKIEKNAAVNFFDKQIVMHKRSHAKYSLSELYTAMKSFKDKHGRYTTDLQVAGFSLRNDKLLSKMGFINPFALNTNNQISGLVEDVTRMNTDYINSLPANAETNKRFYTTDVSQITFRDFEKFCKKRCSADDNGFEAIAIVPLGENRFDVWLINETKNLTQVQDGMQGL